MVRIGYVGLDHHHCRPYLRSIEQLDATVTCVCEPSATPTPANVPELDDDVPFYRDYEELLSAEAVDLLWVTTSNRTTPEVLKAAIERGVDVFTEKPGARTAAELDPVAAAARSADVTVGVSYPWRAHPIAERLRELAASGFFGDVRAFDARFVASSVDARDTDHYLFDSAASRGGIVQWLGVHWLDLVPWLLDDRIVEVGAQFGNESDDVNVETGATIQLKTMSGAVGSLHCGYHLREGRYDTQIDVYGDGGRCSWDPIGRQFGFDGETTLELEDHDGSWQGTPQRTTTYEYESAPGYGGQWGLHFLKANLSALTNEGSVPVNLADALQVLRVLDAVYESADRETNVRVSEPRLAGQ